MNNQKKIDSSQGDELHLFWWLYLPILFFCFRYAAYLFTDAESGLESWLTGELGLIENLTVLLLVLAVICTCLVIFRFGKSLHVTPKIFLVVYCLGCIYFAGEEASWGQHWFGWQTSEYFKEINDQDETNLHNTSIWLDRIPKAIVSLSIFIGGIVVPLYIGFRGKQNNYQARFWWLWPTRICLPTAIIATTVTWPAKIERELDASFYFRLSNEMKEFYIACFFLVFIVSLAIRLYRLNQQGTEFSPA